MAEYGLQIFNASGGIILNSTSRSGIILGNLIVNGDTRNGGVYGNPGAWRQFDVGGLSAGDRLWAQICNLADYGNAMGQNYSAGAQIMPNGYTIRYRVDMQVNNGQSLLTWGIR